MSQVIGRPAAGPASSEDLAGTWGLPVLCAVLFLTFLDTTVVSVALADVQQRLHAGVSELQWVVNGYALVFASLMLLCGSLGDFFGRKKVMLVGLGVFCAGSLLAALAPNPDVLIAGRVVMGAGAAASEPGTLSMIRHLYPSREPRAHALGAWAAVSGLALALGPVLGGALVGLWQWRAIFFFNLFAGILVLIGAAVVLPESADPVDGSGLDLWGFGLGTLTLASLVFAVTVGETTGYGYAPIVALFAVAAIAFVAFVLVERRSRSPMLELGYLHRPAFSGALFVAFAVFFGIFSIFFFTALYLQSVVGYSAWKTSEEFLAMAAAMIVASLFAGRLVGAIGPRLPMAAGCALSGVGILFADSVLQGNADFGQLAAYLALSGLGFGLAVVPMTSVTLSVVRPEKSGMAASATNTSRELGAVIGVAVLGALVNGHLTTDLAARLHALGIPNVFQAIVIHAIETGTVPPSSSKASQVYGPIVGKVIAAAYGAFRSGLDLALLVSAAMILLAALVSLTTLRHGRGVVEEGA